MCKVFFWLRSVGRRDLSAGPDKKNTPPSVIHFFAPAPGKGRGRRSPVGRRHRARAKKNTTLGFFLLRLRGKAGEGEAPLGAGTEPEQKKKNTTSGFSFFLLRPRGKAGEGEAPLGAGTGPEQKKKTPPSVFFLLRPRGKAGEGEAPLGAGTGPKQKKKKETTQGVFFFAPAQGKGRGRRSPVGRRQWARAKKKHHPRCLFFCSGPGERQGKEKPRWAPARGQSKKKTPRWVFLFFAAAPVQGRGRRSPVGRRDLSAWPEQRKRRTARAFLFVLVLLFRAWCYWFLEFCLLSSSGVQSFLLLRAIGCKLFGGAGAKKNTIQSSSIVAAAFVGLHHFSVPSQPACHWSRSFLLLVSGVQECFVCRGRLGSDTFQRAPKKNNRTTTLFLRAHGVFL